MRSKAVLAATVRVGLVYYKCKPKRERERESGLGGTMGAGVGQSTGYISVHETDQTHSRFRSHQEISQSSWNNSIRSGH